MRCPLATASSPLQALFSIEQAPKFFSGSSDRAASTHYSGSLSNPESGGISHIGRVEPVSGGI